MKASVLIPARNAARTIAATVTSALEQSMPPLEVIVIDDASTDDTADVAEQAGARVIRSERQRNAGGARNLGLEAARGDAIFFLDADAVVSPNWIETATAKFAANPEIAAFAGRMINGRPSRYGKLDYYMNHSEWITSSPACEKANIPTMAIIYRRSAIEGIRFVESNSGEDTAFALAVTARGARLWWDPAVTVTHFHERLDRKSYWEKQIVCGGTIFWTRSVFDRPGKILVKWPVTVFLFPHLWLMVLRMIRNGAVLDAVTLFPWFVAGEIARAIGFFRARREGIPAWAKEAVQAR